jgi:hypothetical protein
LVREERYSGAVVEAIKPSGRGVFCGSYQDLTHIYHFDRLGVCLQCPLDSRVVLLWTNSLTIRDIKTRLIDSQPEAAAPTTLGADKRSADLNKKAQDQQTGCCS